MHEHPPLIDGKQLKCSLSRTTSTDKTSMWNKMNITAGIRLYYVICLADKTILVIHWFNTDRKLVFSLEKAHLIDKSRWSVLFSEQP